MRLVTNIARLLRRSVDWCSLKLHRWCVCFQECTILVQCGRRLSATVFESAHYSYIARRCSRGFRAVSPENSLKEDVYGVVPFTITTVFSKCTHIAITICNCKSLRECYVSTISPLLTLTYPREFTRAFHGMVRLGPADEQV